MGKPDRGLLAAQLGAMSVLVLVVINLVRGDWLMAATCLSIVAVASVLIGLVSLPE